MGMMAPPFILRSVEERARAVLRTGWRPPLGAGPTRDELAELIGVRGRPGVIERGRPAAVRNKPNRRGAACAREHFDVRMVWSRSPFHGGRWWAGPWRR